MCWKRGQTPQHHPRHLHFRERKVRDRGVSVHRPVEWALHRGAKRSLPGGTSRIYHFTLFAPCCVSTFLLFFAVFAVFHFSPRGAFFTILLFFAVFTVFLFSRGSLFLQFYVFSFLHFSAPRRWYIGSCSFSPFNRFTFSSP